MLVYALQEAGPDRFLKLMSHLILKNMEKYPSRKSRLLGFDVILTLSGFLLTLFSNISILFFSFFFQKNFFQKLDVVWHLSSPVRQIAGTPDPKLSCEPSSQHSQCCRLKSH